MKTSAMPLMNPSLCRRTCPTQSPAVMRRGLGLASLASALGLALIPKCPACLAGYVALATGIGLSVPAATHLRTVLLTLSVSLLGFGLFTAFLNMKPPKEKSTP